MPQVAVAVAVNGTGSHSEPGADDGIQAKSRSGSRGLPGRSGFDVALVEGERI